MSPSAAPQGRQLALHALAVESRGDDAPEIVVASAERVLEQLRERLATWFGSDGFAMLLARSLGRARAEHPWLPLFESDVLPDRWLRMLVEGPHVPESTAAHEAIVTLLAGLFTLLIGLVGEDFVSRLTHQIWPDDSPHRRDHADV